MDKWLIVFIVIPFLHVITCARSQLMSTITDWFCSVCIPGRIYQMVRYYK